MKEFSLTTIGDCCIDIYPDFKKTFLGGTAFNVAYNAKKAGFKSSIISLVGEDSSGDLFLQKAHEIVLNTMHLQRIPGHTSSVQIPLDSAKKPVFGAWDIGVLEQLRLTAGHKKFLQTQDVVRAILLKPLQKSFDQFCQMQLSNTFKVGDLAGGSIYSIDTQEIENYIPGLDMIVRSVDTSQTAELALLKELARKYNKIILASLGSDGSIVFTKDQEYFEPAFPVNVTDTTGAGDAYIAYFLLEYLQSKNIPSAMKEGAIAASRVITQFGSTIDD